MKTRMLLFLPSIVVLLFVSACGPSQIEIDATATQVAADIFATLTAQAPTATPTYTPTPTATFTPSPTATSTPTLTPTSTSTPIYTSTPTPIPGWTKFEAENVEIWLPDSFKGGDIQNDLDVILNNIKNFGPEYEQMADMIKANPDVFVLWAVDTNIGTSGYLTNMQIAHQQVISAVTIDLFAAAMTQQLPSDFTIISQEKVHLGQYDAIQLVIEFKLSGILGRELVYVIKNNGVIWTIAYTTGIDEFETRLPIFEQSANTIDIHP